MQQSKVISFHFSGFLLPKTPRRHFFFRQENSGHLKLFLPVGVGCCWRPLWRPVYSLVPSSLMGEGDFFFQDGYFQRPHFLVCKKSRNQSCPFGDFAWDLSESDCNQPCFSFGKTPGFEGLAYALLRSPSRSRSPQFPV